eukprot:TRINITY_DN5730_c0_g1_i1.p2 TRINITY_DN5730_c0_g1~~TRINITY_DN5730_c0_g1_i1.p2  ORF type:complete len:166 (+),score=40.78 TRINITY_DN5730_c0_g1_i1:74-571(+)
MLKIVFAVLFVALVGVASANPEPIPITSLVKLIKDVENENRNGDVPIPGDDEAMMEHNGWDCACNCAMKANSVVVPEAPVAPIHPLDTDEAPVPPTTAPHLTQMSFTMPHFTSDTPLSFACKTCRSRCGRKMPGVAKNEMCHMICDAVHCGEMPQRGLMAMHLSH